MTTSIAPIDPPLRHLLGPGPSDIHPSVLSAMARPTVGHLDPYYLSVMDQMQSMLRDVFRTTNRLTFAVSGTGSAGQEATIVNLVEPGDSVLICVNGVFGGRMADMAERAGGEVHRIERPWGEVFSTEEVQSAIAKVKPKIVGLVMAETSTGAWQPVDEISRVVHEAGALLVVDTVTALGGIPVEVDAWQIDAAYAGTQKCLSCPPGLAPVTFSPAAVEKAQQRREKVRSWYLDVTMLASYWGKDRVYHHTAPINMTYALHEALRLLLEEGLDQAHARHRRNHQALRAGLAAIGMSYATATERTLPQLNAVLVPEGIDEAAIRRDLLDEFHIEIGAGLGAYKGKVWRIGLMGYGSRQESVLNLLAALEQLLSRNGHKIQPGTAVAAASGVYCSEVPSA